MSLTFVVLGSANIKALCQIAIILSKHILSIMFSVHQEPETNGLCTVPACRPHSGGTVL